jgi:hypothetical protein
MIGRAVTVHVAVKLPPGRTDGVSRTGLPSSIQPSGTWSCTLAAISGDVPSLTRLVETVNGRAARLAQGFAHRAVPVEGGAVLVEAVVVLEVVDAPVDPRPRVDVLVVEAGGVARARVRAGGRVDAELQALGVDVVGQSLDTAGKANSVGLQSASVSRSRAIQQSSMLT